MRIGVDSYSYHRLLGEVRPGESDVKERWRTHDVLNEVRSLGVDAVSLETCFIDGSTELHHLSRAKRDLEVVLAWGHRDGLRYGADRHALADARDWVNIAADLGVHTLRVVAASPWVPRTVDDVPRTVFALAELVQLASGHVTIALENHADLSADEFVAVIDNVPELRVCLDTANALRIGADPVDLARTLASRTAMVHLKDVSVERTPTTSGPRSCPYGQGDVDLAGVLNAVGGSSFEGVVCVELGHLGTEPVDERSMVRECVHWLERRRREERSSTDVTPIR